MELTAKKCVPCEGGIPALTKDSIDFFYDQLKKGWVIIDDKYISITFHFVNFKQTMDFVNEITEIAEEEGHHPVLHVHYGKLIIDIWTHAVNGLTENDFILASKIEEIV